MDDLNTNQNPVETDGGAWAMARIGNAIDVMVDRTINKPTLVYDSNTAYGVDSNGGLYTLGQPNRSGVKTNADVGGGGSMMLLVILAVVLAVHH